VLAGASYLATQGVTGVPANTLRKYVVRHGLVRREAQRAFIEGECRIGGSVQCCGAFRNFCLA